jgi:integrase/recombinase XerD
LTGLGVFLVKRPNGSGTIVRLSGARRRPYAVRVSGRDEHGHIIQTVLSYHAKLQEAQTALDEYNRKKAAGCAPAAGTLAMTVGQVYEAWSAREYRKCGSASQASHKSTWNKRVSRYADRKIRSVTLDEWQAILDEAEAEGLSQSTINNAVILIHALCAYAAQRDIIGKDYSVYLDVPSVDPKQKKGAFSDLQVRQLEDMAAAGVPWADTVLVLCYTGLRISEFAQLTPFSYHPDQGGYLQGGLKTDAGRDRIIPIHPKIKPYIDRALAARGPYLFTHDGDYLSPSWYRVNAFPPIARALGTPEATPHWCRHTFATRLHAANADPLATKRLLGHSTKGDITARYTHDSLAVLKRNILLLA